MVYVIFGVRVTTLRKPDIWGQSNHSPQALFKALGFLLRPQLSTPTPTIHPNYHHLGSPQKAKDIASKTVFPGKVLFNGMKRFSDFFHNTSLYITKEGIVAQTHKLFHGCDQ